MSTMMIESPHRPLIIAAHFMLTPYGVEVFNYPPDDAPPPYDEWEWFTQKLFDIRRAVQLGIGDMLNFGELTYGETYAQVSAKTDIDPAQLMNYKWVASRVPLKWRISFANEDLDLFTYTFCYHAARVENEQRRRELIELAVAEKWDSSQMKSVVDKLNNGKSPDAHAVLNRAIANLQTALKLNPKWKIPLASILKRLQKLSDKG